MQVYADLTNRSIPIGHCPEQVEGAMLNFFQLKIIFGYFSLRIGLALFQLSFRIPLAFRNKDFLETVIYNLTGFPRAWLHLGGTSVKKKKTCLSIQIKRCGFNPWIGKIPGEGNGNPLQCSCLENPRTEEPGGFQSILLHKDGHIWSDLEHSTAHVSW